MNSSVAARSGDAKTLLGLLMSRIAPRIGYILDKAMDGREITWEEGAALFATRGAEFSALMLTADELRRRAAGDAVTYVVNRNINFSNVCTVGCGFCAFRAGAGGARAYRLSISEIAARAQEAYRQGATEVCLQGGIDPELEVRFYIDVCEAIKSAAPEIHIHAFSPMEIATGAKRLGCDLETYLKRLKEAGLGSIPGTAAEILDDEIRRVICPGKIDVETWVTVIKTAHQVGLPSTSTMMYGHVETPDHWARHLSLLRDIQKTTGGFTEFVPLSFIHPNTVLYKRGLVRPWVSGTAEIKVHAVARIMLNGYINNIQVSWVKLGPKLAQVCLEAGANDLGGTLTEERISSSAGATWGQSMAEEELCRLINDVDRTPAQRTTTYQIVRTGPEIK